MILIGDNNKAIKYNFRGNNKLLVVSGKKGPTRTNWIIEEAMGDSGCDMYDTICAFQLPNDRLCPGLTANYLGQSCVWIRLLNGEERSFEGDAQISLN